MRRAAVGAVLAALAVLPAAAIPPEFPGGSALPMAGPTPPGAKAIIDQLGSDDYRAREKAGKSILALGDRALPALKAALASTDDPEVHRRIEVLVEQLETERLVSPRRVTLKVKDKSVADIVAELAKQSGYPLQYQDGRDGVQKLSFDLADVPFWEALDRVCDAAGLNAFQQNDETGVLTLGFNDTYNPHVAYWGPFRILATNISSGRNLQLSGLSRRQPNPRQPEYLTVNLNLFAEPKAPVLGLGPPTVTKATDDTGASMLVPQAEPSSSFYPPPVGYRSFNHGFGVSLHRVNQKATAIKELRGKVPAVILSEVRPEVVVPDVLKAKKKRFPGRSVDLEVGAVDYANDVLSLELTVRRRHGDPEDYNWLNILPQRLEVTDAAGGKFQFGGVTNQNAGPNVATSQMQFSHPGDKKVGKPARLTLVEWVTVSRDVEFTFKDIPLP
jgi:hypothetical protein